MKTIEDTQLNHHLWDLYKSLDNHFRDKKYEDIIEKRLSPEICDDVDKVVAYIKLEY